MTQKAQLSNTFLCNTSKLMLSLEWVWIAIMLLSYWHISPPIRDNYVFILIFSIPIYLARFVIHRRIFTRTPLDLFLLIFVILTVYNFHNAPLARANYWVLVCRPLMGIFIIYYFVEHARIHGHTRYLIAVTVCLTTLIGVIALLSSQWTISTKSDDFAFIINLLPKLDHKSVLPDMQLSFNPNEIAGALAYCCPFLLSISLWRFRQEPDTPSSRLDVVVHVIERYVAPVGFVIAFSALFLGQSRFALAGTFVGLFIVLLVILPDWRKRAVGVSIWSVFVLLEIALVLNILPLDLSPPPSNPDETVTTNTTGLNERDNRTLVARLDLWDRAIQMVIDYPDTGAGMSVYRAMVTRDEYAIPLYVEQDKRPPHAHNAFLQMGADLGVMGFVLFIGWYGIVVWMVVYCFRHSNLNSKIMSVAVAGSILSYMGYGIGDTITLWDRFAFMHWWFIALMAAIYITVRLDNK